MLAESIIKPKRPRGAGWQQMPSPPTWVTLGFAGEVWSYSERGLIVISAVEVAQDKDKIDRGPEYHLSISKHTASAVVRCSSKEAAWVLAQFELEGAEEDNHAPHGRVRNFWRPVADNLVGLECGCKAEEPVIKEDKGDYIWRPAE